MEEVESPAMRRFAGSRVLGNGQRRQVVEEAFDKRVKDKGSLLSVKQGFPMAQWEGLANQLLYSSLPCNLTSLSFLQDRHN